MTRPATALAMLIVRDSRLALRGFLRQPSLTAAAVLSIAVGVGANVAVFSLTKAILIEPLPYADPSRVVAVGVVSPSDARQTVQATAPEYIAWKERAADVFDSIATEAQLTRDLGASENGAPPERINAQNFTASMFQVLGVSPLLGRVFNSQEDLLDNPAAVVLVSEGLWQRRFGRDPGIVGKRLVLDGSPMTVIGIMPSTFRYHTPGPVDIWAPLSFNKAQLLGSARGYFVAGRLKPGTTVAQAQARLETLTADLAREFPGRALTPGVRVRPLQEALYGDYRSAMLLLQSVVAGVLLIACANVAGLLLAKGASRRTEIAVRASLGAGRGSIVRQLLVESIVLAVIGGIAGVVLAATALNAVVALGTQVFPRVESVAIDPLVLTFALALSVATGVLFGVVPAIHISRADLSQALRGSAKGSSETAGRQRIRSALVVVQIAVAFALLVASGLLLNSFIRVTRNNLGADTDNVLAFDMRFPGAVNQKIIGTHDGFPFLEVSPVPADTFGRVLERLARLPMVESAGAVNHMPFTGGVFNMGFFLRGRTPPTTQQERQFYSARSLMVTPGLFETMQMPISRGRTFHTTDRSDSPWVVVINEAMAAKFWAPNNPLGDRLTLTLVPDEREREVIGIVRNVSLHPYDQEAAPIMYTLYNQQPVHNRGPFGSERLNMSFVIRVDRNPADARKFVQEAVAEVALDRPISEIRPLADEVATQLRSSRYLTTVTTLCGTLAAALAALGIYSLISYTVAQRTKEIGLRVALGASPRTVLALLARQAAVVVIVGLMTGFIVAYFGARLVAASLWKVEPTDLPTYLGIAVIMGSVAAIATVIPALRALRVQPTIALRQE